MNLKPTAIFLFLSNPLNFYSYDKCSLKNSNNGSFLIFGKIVLRIYFDICVYNDLVDLLSVVAIVNVIIVVVVLDIVAFLKKFIISQ